MQTQNRIREMLYGALLTAMALLIPIAFQGWLQVHIPPFSATIGSHVPSMLAMTISPMAAVLVGIGSAFGFFMTLGPIVAARASIHAIFGAVGASWIRQGRPFWQALLITLPIHVLGEALVVMPFGFDLYQALVVVGIGTGLHHIVDSIVTYALYGALTKAGVPLGLQSRSTVS